MGGGPTTTTERALVLIAQGAEMREAGLADEARSRLREAIAIAEREGAGSIEERARDELAKTAGIAARLA
jgi:hypothetical protein